ncbi:hypothetical protein SAMN05421778_10552 [Sphaerotilus natans]|nr:hypothetical protein SAMN05421778_10552 [Sphaerotilus natans]
MTALDLMAVVLEDGYLTPGVCAHTVVHSWLNELRRAVSAGEVTPRNPSSRLPCAADFEALDGWMLTRADASRLLAPAGIDLDAVLTRLLDASRRAGRTEYHHETGEPIRTLWYAGFMPPEHEQVKPTRIVPGEWCSLLPDFGLPPTLELPPEPAQAAAATEAAPSASASPAARPEAVAVPLQRQRHQEAEILRVLRELGRDPTALPRNDPGKAGPKAAVRQRLGHLPGWGVSVFNKAWERLRESGDIKDA